LAVVCFAFNKTNYALFLAGPLTNPYEYSSLQMRLLVITATTLLLLPIAIPLKSGQLVGLDIVPSDFLLLLFPIALLRVRNISLPKNVRKILTFNLLSFVFFVMLGVIGSVITGSVGNALSAIKFSKFFLFAHLGVFVACVCPVNRWISTLVNLILLLTIVLLISDFAFNPGWPRPRWGEYFGFSKIYGYPNSSAYFFTVLFAIVLVYIYNFNVGRRMYISLAFLSVFSILSLSRNSASMLILAAGLLPVVSRRLDLKKSIGFLCIIVLISVAVSYRFSEILDALKMRLDVTLAQMQTHSYSGRSEIWLQSIELWFDRPLFGYLFESYSNYSRFGTPHQQYLETLYKSGAVGVFVYFVPIFFVLKYSISQLSISLNRRIVYRRFLAQSLFIVFFITLVSNFFQPNFTYSITANFIFFFLGVVCFYLSQSEKKQPRIRNRQRPY